MGWVYCFEEAMYKSKASTLILSISFFGLMIPLAWLAYFGFPEHAYLSIYIFWGLFTFMVAVSALEATMNSKLPLKVWYEEIFLYGARSIARYLIDLEGNMNPILAYIFEFWWCFCIKYLYPWAMYWILVVNFKNDITTAYGNFHTGWQIIGVLFPVLGILVFLIPCMSTKI